MQLLIEAKADVNANDIVSDRLFVLCLKNLKSQSHALTFQGLKVLNFILYINMRLA